MSDPISAPVKGEPPRLLEQVRNAIRRLHYSYRTEQAYVHWIKRYIWFHGKRHPAELGAPDVTAFLTHLAVAGKVAWVRCGEALSRCSHIEGLAVMLLNFIKIRLGIGDRHVRDGSIALYSLPVVVMRRVLGSDNCVRFDIGRVAR